jgi:hypothetical protein
VGAALREALGQQVHRILVLVCAGRGGGLRYSPEYERVTQVTTDTKQQPVFIAAEQCIRAEVVSNDVED